MRLFENSLDDVFAVRRSQKSSTFSHVRKSIFVIYWVVTTCLLIHGIILCAEPGRDKEGRAVYLQDIWPSREEIQVRMRTVYDLCDVCFGTKLYLLLVGGMLVSVRGDMVVGSKSPNVMLGHVVMGQKTGSGHVQPTIIRLSL